MTNSRYPAATAPLPPAGDSASLTSNPNFIITALQERLDSIRYHDSNRRFIQQREALRASV